MILRDLKYNFGRSVLVVLLCMLVGTCCVLAHTPLSDSLNTTLALSTFCDEEAVILTNFHDDVCAESPPIYTVDEEEFSVNVTRRQYQEATGTSPTAVLNSQPIAGNLLVVIAGHRKNAGTATIGGSGWQQQVSFDAYDGASNNRRGITIWTKIAGQNEPTSITASVGDGTSKVLVQEFEVSNATFTIIDQVASNQGSITPETWVSTGTTPTTSNTHTLVVGAMVGRGSAGNTPNFGNGLHSSVGTNEPGTNYPSLWSGFVRQTSSGPQTSLVSWSSSIQASAAIIAYGISAGGSGGSTGDCSARVSSGLIAHYDFTEGSGIIVNDISGYGTPLDLVIANPANASWLSGDCGLSVNSSTLLESTGNATKIATACKATNEYSLEVWAKASNTTQGGPARIIEMGDGNGNNRNFMFGPAGSSDYESRIRTTSNVSGFSPELDGGTPSTSLNHYVVTRNSSGVERIYVNGSQVATHTVGGNLSNWSDFYTLQVANRDGQNRPWLGELYKVAIYDKDLSGAEVLTNYGEGHCCSHTYDYSDAPLSYGDACAPAQSFVMLGTLIDAEADSHNNINASGDDNNGVDDDDGITFVGGTNLTRGTSESVSVVFTTTYNDVYINGWIDFNGDGDFDSNERVINDDSVGQSTSSPRSYSFTVPSWAVCGTTYARFRISDDSGKGATTCDGTAGEVEDYMVTIDGCTTAEICNNGIDDDGDGDIDCADSDCASDPSCNSSGGSNSCNLIVRALGSCGGESLQLRINNVTVATYTLTTSFVDYTYSGYTQGDNVSLYFLDQGNGCDHNARIDYITAGASVYEMEQSTNNQGCNTSGSEWMWCTGTADFGNLVCSQSGGGAPITCTSGQTIDHYGEGCSGSNININVPNLSNVDRTVVEVVYKGCNPGNSVTVSSSIGNLSLPRIIVPGGSSNARVYRLELNQSVTNLTAVSECGTCGTGNGMQSLLVYAIRNVDTGVSYESTFTSLSGYCDVETISIPINTASSPRDVEVILPLSEITNDGRYLTVEAASNVGSVSDSETIFGPDLSLGCCFYLMELTLVDVPANATAIDITITSNGANNPNGSSCGQSYILGGTTYTELECSCVDITANAGPNVSMCSGNDTILSGSATGGSGGTSYSWSPATGLSNPNIANPTASPTTTTTYTLTTTGSDGCTDTDQVTVTVVDQYTSGGTISGDQAVCGSGYDPAMIGSTAPPSGGSGGTPYYEWQKREKPCGGSYSAWSVIPGANSSTYDPPAITMTTQYNRRARRLDGCSPLWRNANTVTKTVIEQFTAAGTIAGDESHCGAYDPAIITSTAAPSGGCEGSTVYIWQQRTKNCSTGAWSGWANITVNGASATYDPPSITVTTQYRRVTWRAGGCTPENLVSNVIEKTVVEDLANGGSISADQSDCGAFNPVNITGTVPSGACTTQGIDYQWQKREALGGPWTDISGATGQTYNPPSITVTTQYRRVASTEICGDLYSDAVTATINNEPQVTLQDTDFCPGAGFIVDPDVCIEYPEIKAIRPLDNVNWNNQFYQGGPALTGDGKLCFDLAVAPNNSFNMLGLTSDPNANASFSSIDYALYIINTAGSYRIRPYENGTNRGDKYSSTTPLLGSTFCIERAGTTITYLMDGNLLYTSTVASSADLYFDNSFHSSGVQHSEFNNIQLCGPASSIDANYSWSTGASTSTISTSSPGTYTVTVTDDNGCTATDDIVLTLSDLMADAGQDFTLCSSDGSVALFGSTAEPSANITWTTTGSGFLLSDDDLDPRYYPTQADYNNGSVTFTMTVDYNGCTDTDQVVVTFLDPQVSVDQTQDRVCAGDNVTVTVTGSNSYTYQWYGPNGFTQSGKNLSLNNVNIDHSGVYYLHVTNSLGCVSITGNKEFMLAVDDEFVRTEVGSYGLSTTDWTQSISVDKFDNTFGSLTQVTVKSQLGVSTRYGMEYTGNGGSSLSYTGTHDGDVTTPLNNTVALDLNVSQSLSVSAFDGTVDFGGTSAFRGSTLGYTEDVQLTSSVSSFVGSGMIDFTGATLTSTSFQGGGNGVNFVRTVAGYAGVVHYHYQQSISLPATLDACVGSTISLTATGNDNFTYNWTTPAGNLTGKTITVNNAQLASAGNYMVSQQLDSCTTIEALTVVTVNPAPSVTAEDREICVGLNYTFTVDASGGALPYTYLWSNGDTVETITASPPSTTSFGITVTDDNGCTAETSMLVTVNPRPVFTPLPPVEVCQGDSVHLIFSATGNGPFSFSRGKFPFSGNTYSFLPTQTTTLNFQVTDANGCVDSEQVVVTVHPLPTATATNDGPITCADPTVTLTAGPAGMAYLWSNNATTRTPGVTTPGTYTVTVTDANGCTSTAQSVVTQDITAPTANAGVDQNICSGAPVTLTATGGGTYAWSNGASTASITVSPTASVGYTVTVTAANGCTDTDDIVVSVEQPSATPVASEDVDICPGETVTLRVNENISTGGLIDYSTWTVGTGSTTGFNQNGATTENHRISGTGPWGELTVVWEARPEGNNSSDGGWNTSRFDIDHTKTYRYSVWVNRKVLGPDGRFYLGTYGYGSVNGIKRVDNGATITNPYFEVSPTPPNYGQDRWVLVVGHVHPSGYTSTSKHPDSGVYATDIGYVEPINLDYKWLPQTIESIHRSYLFYSSTTTPKQQWVYPRVDLVDGSEPSIDELLNGYDINGGLGDGATWEWYTGSCGGTSVGSGTDLIVTPSATTTYYVRGEGNCGNSACDQVTITVNTPPSPSISNNGPITCAQPSVTMTANPAGMTYAWSGGGTSRTKTVTSPGTYTVTVTNSQGCSSTAQTTVTQDITAPTANAGPDQTICDGDSATLSAVGGVSYSWDNSLGAGSSHTVSLSATTTYTVTVTASNGCTDTDQVTINVTPNPVASPGNNGNLCDGNSHVWLATDAGVGATYTWSFGPLATPTTATGRGPHTVVYNLVNANVNQSTITTLSVDLNGCSATGTDQFFLLANPVTSLGHTDPSCDADDGTITITFSDNPNRTGIEFSIDGGSTWSAGVNDNTGSYTFTELAAGTYNVQARWGDDSCPVAVGLVTLAPYTDISTPGSISGGDSQCGSYDPAIITSAAPASGGTGGNIAYRWQYREWDCTASNWGAWAWVAGNSNSASYDPAVISVSRQYRRRANRIGCSGWDESNIVTFDVYENGAPGTIGVDQEYCESGNPPAFTSVVASGGSCNGTLEYQWQYRQGTSGTWIDLQGETSETRDPGPMAQTQQYRRLARWSSSCPWVSSNVVTITINDAPAVSISSTDTNPCYNTAITLTATGSGGSGTSYTYAWSGGLGSGSSKTITAAATSSYLVTVTDSNGCTSTDEQTITVRDIITDYGSISGDQSNCGPFDPSVISGTAITTSGSNITPTYQWEVLDNGVWVDVVGAVSIDYDPPLTTETTSYRRRAYMQNGCGNAPTNVVTMTVHSTFSATATNDGPITCADPTVTLTAGPVGMTYLWSNNATSQTTNVSTPGTYTVTVTDANGCSSTAQTVVTQDITAPTVDAGANQTVCSGDNVTLTATGGGTYSWSTGGNTASISINPTYTATYTVTVTAANGCTNTDLVNVTIDNVPTTPFAGPDQDICLGENVSLSIDQSLFGGGEIDHTTWQTGTGSTGNFSRLGTDAENHRVYAEGPWGESSVVWEARPDAASGPDGGWNMNSLPVDHTKAYRVSVWVNRKVRGTDGRFYMGVYGNGSVNGVENINDGSVNTNPYFWYSAPGATDMPEDEWVLVVGHIYPSDHTGTSLHAESGRYTASSGKIGNNHRDFRWLPQTNTARPRTYLFYTTDQSVRQQWIYPRFDIIDGNEPSIDVLLNGYDSNQGLGGTGFWEWFTGSCGGTSAGSGTSISVSPTTTTTYYVRGENHCGDSVCDEVVVTVNTPPVAAVTKDGDITCADPTVTLTATPAGMTYAWSGGGTAQTKDITTPGTHSVTVTDGNGCTDVATINVIENTTPTNVFCQRYRIYDNTVDVWGPWTNFSGNCTIEMCENDGTDHIQFDGGPDINTGWVWTDEDNNVDSEVDEMVVFASIGADDAGTYKGVLTNEYGCTSTVTFTVIVHANPAAAAINNGPITCAQPTVTMTANPAGMTYAWSGGGTSRTKSVTAPGTYTVTVTDVEGCSSTAQTVVTEDTAPPIADAGADQTICRGDNASISASGGASYQWGSGLGLGASHIVSPNTTTTYTVTVTDTNGCTATDQVTIYVNTAVVFNVAKATDLGCDGSCEGSFVVYTSHAATGDYNVIYSHNGSTHTIGPFMADSAVIDGLCAGSYTGITIQAINSGCAEVWGGSNVTINQTSADWEHVTLQSDVSDCDGACDGSFIIDANLAATGDFNVEYTYNGVVVQLGPYSFAGDIVIDGLCAGTYSDVTIISITSGCIDVWPTAIAINEPTPDATVTSFVDDACLAADGTATVSVSGGMAPYTIEWESVDGSITGSGIRSAQGNYVIPNLLGGHTYCITVTDTNGCSSE